MLLLLLLLIMVAAAVARPVISVPRPRDGGCWSCSGACWQCVSLARRRRWRRKTRRLRAEEEEEEEEEEWHCQRRRRRRRRLRLRLRLRLQQLDISSRRLPPLMPPRRAASRDRGSGGKRFAHGSGGGWRQKWHPTAAAVPS